MHGDDEGVEILVIDDDSDEEDGDVDDAEVGEVADAVDDGGEVEGVLQLAVTVGEVQFVEQQEEEAVQQHAGLVVVGLEHRAEEVEVVGEEQPLEDQHLVDVVGPEGAFVGQDGQVLAGGGFLEVALHLLLIYNHCFESILNRE